MAVRAAPGFAHSTIETVASADVSAKLERLCEGALMERGSVVLIGLDQIKRELSNRWTRRKEQVGEQSERRIRARLSDGDIPRPRARAIIVHPHLTKSTFAMLRYAQIDELSACARDLGRDVREISGNMIAFAMAAREIASMVLVTRISTHALADCAEGAGITHLGVCGDLSESVVVSEAAA